MKRKEKSVSPKHRASMQRLVSGHRARDSSICWLVRGLNIHDTKDLAADHGTANHSRRRAGVAGRSGSRAVFLLRIDGVRCCSLVCAG